MTDGTKVTAAAYPVQLGEKEFLFSPFTDKDITELDLWLQARYIANARNSLEGVTEEAVRRWQMELALESALTVTLMSRAGQSVFSTIEGLSRLVWQAVKRNHEGVTPQEIRELLFDPDNVSKVNEAFEKLNATKQPAKSEGDKKGGAHRRR